ncbi:MAG: DNA-deoxyinosine glycosylase [Cellvibrionales bacterium]|nr:DNA-deoxyinosine glycosylase [Cellvibrionales bacterium]
MVNSFSPVLKKGASIIILGSMPGKRSLQEAQYYAHPRNAFWRIFCTLFMRDKDWVDSIDNYQQKIECLKNENIALWDVLQSCTRKSSLDADIVESSIVVNDFSKLFTDNQSIKHIYFNGAKAEKLYKRYVIPTLSAQEKSLSMTRLPSTSPAHAAISFEKKLQEWKVICR